MSFFVNKVLINNNIQLPQIEWKLVYLIVYFILLSTILDSNLFPSGGRGTHALIV